MQAEVAAELVAEDGQRIEAGGTLARLHGNVRDLLTCERTLLNLLGRLMGRRNCGCSNDCGCDAGCGCN